MTTWKDLGKTKDADKTWTVIADLGTIKKNKTDTIKVTKASYAGVELISLQVWKTTEDGKEFPVKDQKTNFKSELLPTVIEVLKKGLP